MSQAGGRRFATLVVGRARITGRRISGEVIAQEDLRSYYDTRVAPVEERNVSQRRQSHSAERAKFQASLRIEEAGRQGRGTGTTFFAVSPNGSKLGGSTAAAATWAALAAWDRSHPAPRASTSYDDWLAHFAEETVRTWRCELVHGDGRREQPDVVDQEWSWWGAPLVMIGAVLDRLADEGWSLVHVSEDRGLYVGADVQEESYPTRFRYLLTRPV